MCVCEAIMCVIVCAGVWVNVGECVVFVRSVCVGILPGVFKGPHVPLVEAWGRAHIV